MTNEEKLLTKLIKTMNEQLAKLQDHNGIAMVQPEVVSAVEIVIQRATNRVNILKNRQIQTKKQELDFEKQHIADRILEAMKNGHNCENCIDLDNWKFCTGLLFIVADAEKLGMNKDEIRSLIEPHYILHYR